MRILLVNDIALDKGWGAELHMARLAEGLAQAGDEVEVFAGEIEHRGRSRLLDVWDPSSRRALARIAERFRPNVVHHNNILRELSVSVLGVPQDAAVVLTIQDLRIFGVPDGPAGPTRRVAISTKARFDLAIARKRVQVVVGISEEIARRLRLAGFPAVEHVPIMAPPPTQPALAVSDSHDVVFAGRLTPDKGPHVLLAAFKLVADRYPSARLVIAGDGPDRVALETAAAALGDRVRFLGRIAPALVQEAMGRARVVVAPAIPSLRPEGAGLTPIEAGLVGRPSIVSNDAALREFVDTSGAGLIVAPGSESELAAALERLLADPALASRLGEAARRSAMTRHTAAAIVPQMQSIYRRSRVLAGLDLDDTARSHGGSRNDELT